MSIPDITDDLIGGAVDIPNTSETITDAEVPDPEGYRVCGSKLLIRPVKTNYDKVGSVFVPDTVKADVKYLHNVGRVLDFGPRAFKRKDDSVVEWVKGGLKVGDIVQWERFSGKRIRYKGVNLVLLEATAINGVVDSQYDLDAMTAIGDNT